MRLLPSFSPLSVYCSAISRLRCVILRIQVGTTARFKISKLPDELIKLYSQSLNWDSSTVRSKFNTTAATWTSDTNTMSLSSGGRRRRRRLPLLHCASAPQQTNTRLLRLLYCPRSAVEAVLKAREIGARENKKPMKKKQC
jgi:hypothetical protein